MSPLLTFGTLGMLLPLCCLPLMMLFVAVSRHAAERGENLLLGFLVGVALTLPMAVAAVAVARVKLTLSPVLQVLARFTLLLLAAGVLSAGLALLLKKPILGLLAITGWGIPLAALYLAVDLTAGFSRRRALVLLTLLVSAFVAVWLLAPFQAQPASIVTEAAAPGDLVLLSWNVGLGQPFSAGSQRQHLDAIVAAIQQHKADVVCLQELGGQEHLKVLLAGLGPPWQGHLSLDGNRVPAVLSRLPGTFRSPRQDFPFGGPASALLETPGGPLEVLTLHLPAEQNALGREMYVDWLINEVRGRQVPVVVGGDFNLDPGGWWDRVSPLLTDDLERDQRSLTRLRELGVDVGRDASATSALSRRLDIILAPPALRCVQYHVLHGTRQGRMDHWPILVRLRWTK